MLPVRVCFCSIEAGCIGEENRPRNRAMNGESRSVKIGSDGLVRFTIQRFSIHAPDFSHRQGEPSRFYSASRMNERHIRWTPHMSRDFEVLIFGDGRGLPLILFPISFGRYSQNKDFGLTTACAPFVDSAGTTGITARHAAVLSLDVMRCSKCVRKMTTDENPNQ